MLAKAGQSKTVKFASQLEQDSKASLAVIGETPNTNRNQKTKPSFSNILLKHKDDLGLTSVSSTLKERERHENKESKEEKRRNEMNVLGLGGSKSPSHTMTSPKGRLGGRGSPHHTGSSNREVDPETAKKNTQNANDVRSGYLELIVIIFNRSYSC